MLSYVSATSRGTLNTIPLSLQNIFIHPHNSFVRPAGNIPQCEAFPGHACDIVVTWHGDIAQALGARLGQQHSHIT